MMKKLFLVCFSLSQVLLFGLAGVNAPNPLGVFNFSDNDITINPFNWTNYNYTRTSNTIPANSNYGLISGTIIFIDTSSTAKT